MNQEELNGQLDFAETWINVGDYKEGDILTQRVLKYLDKVDAISMTPGWKAVLLTKTQVNRGFLINAKRQTTTYFLSL